MGYSHNGGNNPRRILFHLIFLLYACEQSRVAVGVERRETKGGALRWDSTHDSQVLIKKSVKSQFPLQI